MKKNLFLSFLFFSAILFATQDNHFEKISFSEESIEKESFIDKIYIQNLGVDLQQLQSELSTFIDEPINEKTLDEIEDVVSEFLHDNNIDVKEIEILKKNHLDRSDILICFDKDFSSSSNDIIIDDLISLIFTSDPKLLNEDEIKDLEGVVIEELDFPNKDVFIRKMHQYIGKPLSIDTLNCIKQQTLTFIKDQCSYFVSVKVLENQDITHGKIQVLVFIAKLGDITASGAKYFSNKRILDQFRMNHNENVNIDKINHTLIFLNKNAFRNVSAIYEPSEDLGKTDLHIITKDVLPYRIYTGYDNTGNEIAGKSRFKIGTNLGNIFGLSQQLNAEFKTSPNIHRWWGFSGNYIIPLFLYNELKFLGAYSKTKPYSDPGFLAKGKAWAIGTRYNILIKPIYDGNQELTFGYDFKRTNNFLTFQQELQYDKFIDISQFLIRLDGIINDSKGVTSYDLSVYISPGKMSQYNHRKSFSQERPGVKAHYFYSTFHVDRITKFSYLSWVVNFCLQLASDKLLPTEEISLGGYATIRGYPENEVIGDHGFYIKNELRTLEYSFQTKTIKQKIQFLAFLDMGTVADIDRNILSKNFQFLYSIGPGLRYSMNSHLTAYFDYGFQLKKVEDRVLGKSFNSKAHFGLVVNY